MIVELLTFGDELLDGRRVDTNTAWLGRRFTKHGIPPRFRQTTSDRRDDIVSAFRLALERSDFIVSTGGLGPTTDDVTFEALAKALDLPLVFREEIFPRIEARFHERGLRCPEANRRQAYLPAGALEIRNDWGTAPGIRLDVGKKVIFCLPGVPVEMENLFDTGVRPEIERRLPETERRVEKIYRFMGLGETFVAEAIQKCKLESIPGGEIRVAYTVTFPVVDVALSVLPDLPENAGRILAAADAAIRSELKDHLLAEGNSSPEQRLLTLLKERDRTLAVAESVTGGMITAQLVNVPGSSEVLRGAVVAYSNESKVALLEVRPSTLTEFGAVSEACALEMARGAKLKFGSDYAIATTGIAGPGGATAEKPAGLTFIAWVGPDLELVRRYHFRWERNRNRMAATYESFRELIRHFTEEK
ncbi:MAG: CinA family nicotinamide mononucleotide deamidase-related protein [Pseudomonadota bacterium]